MLWIFNIPNTTFDGQKPTGFVVVPINHWEHFEPNNVALKIPVDISKTSGCVKIIHLQLTKLLPTKVLLHNSISRTIRLNQGHSLYS